MTCALEGDEMNNPTEIIWTAKGIGREIGCSADFVRDTLQRMPGSPVHRLGKRYWAHRDELKSFFEHLAKSPELAQPTPTHSRA